METEPDFYAVTADRSRRFDDLCADAGRDPATIRHSLVCFPPLTPWQSVEYFNDMVGRFAEIGIDEFVLYWPQSWREDPREDVVCEEVATSVVPTTGGRHAVCLSTGIAMGVVQLAIEFLDAPPARIDESREWEAIAEVGFEATDAAAMIFLLMASADPPFRSFELPSGPGWYRLRGHALGRSVDFDLAVREPREHHLLQLWPADGFGQPEEIRADDPWANQS